MKINGVEQSTIPHSDAKTARAFARDIAAHLGLGMSQQIGVLNGKETREMGYAHGAKASVIAEGGVDAYCEEHKDFHNDLSEFMLWHPLRHDDFYTEAATGWLIAIYAHQ